MRDLVDAANERGGKDNITAVIVTVGDVAARDETRAKKLQLKREILARMPLFRPLNDREILRDLAGDRGRRLQARRDRACSEGDKGDELFIVLTGKVKVMRGDAQLATLDPGEHFGEMALMRSQPRSATVSATVRAS